MCFLVFVVAAVVFNTHNHFSFTQNHSAAGQSLQNIPSVCWLCISAVLIFFLPTCVCSGHHAGLAEKEEVCRTGAGASFSALIQKSVLPDFGYM